MVESNTDHRKQNAFSFTTLEAQGAIIHPLQEMENRVFKGVCRSIFGRFNKHLSDKFFEKIRQRNGEGEGGFKY